MGCYSVASTSLHATTALAAWSAVTDATAYQVQYVAASGGATVQISTPSLQMLLSGLTPSTPYNVSVYASVAGVQTLKYTGSMTTAAA